MREQVKQLGHLLMLIFHEHMHPRIYASLCICYRVEGHVSRRDVTRHGCCMSCAKGELS
jgi:hypothetical protein